MRVTLAAGSAVANTVNELLKQMYHFDQGEVRIVGTEELLQDAVILMKLLKVRSMRELRISMSPNLKGLFMARAIIGSVHGVTTWNSESAGYTSTMSVVNFSEHSVFMLRTNTAQHPKCCTDADLILIYLDSKVYELWNSQLMSVDVFSVLNEQTISCNLSSMLYSDLGFDDQS